MRHHQAKLDFRIIPKIGSLVLNDANSYQYLVESIRVFPNQEHFLELINQEGFVNTSYQNLSCGIACLHYGYKPSENGINRLGASLALLQK